MLLYIDPGTGSMLFVAVMGIVSTLFFLLRNLWLKLLFFLNGGRAKKDADRYDYVIFNEGHQYWNIFEPICDEFEARGISCEYYAADADDPGLKKDYQFVHTKHIGSGNKAFAHLNLLNAHICLSTTPGLGVYQWKRSPSVDIYIHIFHALTSGTGYRMFGLDEYDVVLLPGPMAIDYIRELERLREEPPKRLEIVGAPFMDKLLRRCNSSKTVNDDNKGTKTVLLAPTWGSSSIFARFGSRIIDALLQTDYNIILRPHPQSLRVETDLLHSLEEKYADNTRIRWDHSPDNFDSLQTADILISDFSGVMFDFALGFDKPIIYTDTKYDASVYDQAWLEGTPMQFVLLPEIGLQLQEKDFPRLQELLDDLKDNEKYAAGREHARQQLWNYPGESAGKIVDALLEIGSDGSIPA